MKTAIDQLAQGVLTGLVFLVAGLVWRWVRR